MTFAIAIQAAPSTVGRSRPIPPASSTDAEIARIDRLRETRGWSHADLCRRARVDKQTWLELRTGRRAPLRRTKERLAAAIAEQTPARPASVIAAFHRLVMVEIAKARRLKPAHVLATDFSVQRPRNPAWLAAAHVNRIAIYITAVELEVENVAIAAALGCSRQNIQQARNAVEDMREHAATDGLIARVAALVTGRDP